MCCVCCLLLMMALTLVCIIFDTTWTLDLPQGLRMPRAREAGGRVKQRESLQGKHKGSFGVFVNQTLKYRRA